MAQLRTASSVFQKGSLHARPRVSQQEVLTLFGEPFRVSTAKKKGNPLILRYGDVEFHFDPLDEYRLSRVYSDDKDGKIRFCIPPS
jgi:hypothetical protein